MSKSLSLRTLTLGCKVNQYETEFVRQGLIDAGHYRDADEGESADLCIINTCTVTNEGDSKSRQAIRRLARNNPAARVVVMGCYATRAPEELRVLPNVVEVVTDKRELPDLLGRFGVVDIPNGISRFGDRHRAYIKVQDGCLLRCSYCIIPQVRPEMHSRASHEIVEEARRLIDNDYREIVLTGIHLGHYGVDHNSGKAKADWNRLSTLVRRLVEIPGEFRIRLSSIEATEVTRELLEVMRDHADKVCPHLHVCLQSGSDDVLRRMKRRWGSQRFIDRCALVRDYLHKPALTTDVIVGFPGETEAEFQETCDVVRKVGFSKVHIFPFSARRGTPAAEMPDAISKAEKSDRVHRLAEVEAVGRSAYFESLVGEQLEVLIEGTRETSDTGDETMIGTACRYAPVQLPQGVPGTLLSVKIDAACGSEGLRVEQ
ncbi:MAG: tRNA (N(6)-L-threonylcarbamoyladenosine(37)-C(2))-methylthiotransferase MtaB [Planctomycetales bacterium]|nr:tRNA (N(6)-L-threonylcarbamoyladenosine(37)-C(2))-methylthiotransferase MtaB [Planctomycetales bacterium]